ncbi:MAG: hypothetical protein AAFN78_18345, partial [Pseudomonadota bacterium]
MKITNSKVLSWQVTIASVATLFAATAAHAELGYADAVTEFFDSGAGPIPGPYGSPGGVSGPVPVDLDVILGSDTTGYLSLPTGSFVTVEFVDEVIEDAPGDDLIIDERGSGAEDADIFVSSDGVDFTFIGVASGNTASEFDLADIGYTDTVRFVRIVGLDAGGSSPGFDLERVRAPQFVFNSELFAEVVLEFFDSGAGPIDGPYGGPPTANPVPLDVVLGAEPGPLGFNDYLSLPTGSYVTVGFVTGTMIDGPGIDVFVNEAVGAGEDAEIAVSADGVTFTTLGVAGPGGITSFDLADIGFTEPVTAMRITGLDAGGSSPGFDLIGVGVYPGSIGPPVAADTDGDGVFDDLDNCILDANALQVDADGDGIGNVCDGDIAGPGGAGDDDCMINFFDLGQ